MKLTASFQNRLSHQRHSLHPLHQWEFCLWCFWCLKDPGLLPLLPSFFLLLPSLGAKTRRKEKCVNSSAVALHSYKSSARRHLIGSHKKAGWVSVEKELHCSYGDLRHMWRRYTTIYWLVSAATMHVRGTYCRQGCFYNQLADCSSQCCCCCRKHTPAA